MRLIGSIGLSIILWIGEICSGCQCVHIRHFLSIGLSYLDLSA
jgi:hypothetical protein